MNWKILKSNIKQPIYEFLRTIIQIFLFLFWVIVSGMIFWNIVEEYFLLKYCDNIDKLNKIFLITEKAILVYLFAYSFKAKNKLIKYLIVILWLLMSVEFEAQEASYICQRDVIGFFD